MMASPLLPAAAGTQAWLTWTGSWYTVGGGLLMLAGLSPITWASALLQEAKGKLHR